MCLLMVTMGELPKREYLVNASINNPDGYGFAVNHGDRIITGRSMEYNDLIDRFYREMGKSSNPVGMFHARYTTHGKTMVENNHPFRVGGRKDVVLAHNGMLPIRPNDDRSDTRVFAENILNNMGIQQLDDKSAFATLEQFASGSKIAILSTAPELRDSVYILNEHLGDWEGDIWWSNSGYKYSYASSYKYPSGYYGYSQEYKDTLAIADKSIIGRHWWDKDEDVKAEYIQPDDVCYVCQQFLGEDDWMAGYCGTCRSCIDCYDTIEGCLCYTPQARGSFPNLLDYEY